MLTIFAITICVAAFGACRVFEEGEARAYKIVFGTDDPAKIAEIEKDPQKFWHEREAYLMSAGTTISHAEFCAMFEQKAKDYITQQCLERHGFSPAERFPFVDQFCAEHRGKSRDRLTLRVLVYAHLCKYIKYPSYLEKSMQRDGVCEFLLCLDDVGDIFYELHQNVRWLVLPGGVFSLFDFLVMRSRGRYLCSVEENERKISKFSAHSRLFYGWIGVVQHDYYAHSAAQASLGQCLKKFGVSAQKHFDACCNPNVLKVDNIVKLAQQVQGWFKHFHEDPSVEYSFRRDDLFTLLFPQTENFLSAGECDEGFGDVTPYFSFVPVGYDWRQEPLRKSADNDIYTSCSILSGWAQQYCYPGLCFLQRDERKRYINRLVEDLRSTPQSEIERSSQFVQDVLKILCKWDAPDMPGDECAKLAYRSAENMMSELKNAVHLDKESSFVLQAPASVLFVILTSYLDDFHKIQRESSVSLSVLEGKGAACIVRSDPFF